MNIKIEIKIKNKGQLLANAHICLLTTDFGWVNIKDFQIWKSNNFNERLNTNINIQPPTVRTFNRYIKRVFFEDGKKWQYVEKAIYDEYQKKCNEESPINFNEIDDPT